MVSRFLPIAAAVLFATAGSATAAPPVSGIVVGSQRGALLVASPTGLVRTVIGHAAVGTRVSTASGRLVTLGSANRAVIRGVVVRRRGNLTFLSASGHMLVVRTARKLASATDTTPQIGIAPQAGTTPQPGSVVDTSVSIDDQGNLDDQGETQVGDVGQVQAQAVVSAVGPGSVTLTINGQPLTVPLPAGLTLPSSLVGSQVTLNLSFGNGQATASGEQGDDDNGASGNSGGIGITGTSGGIGITGSGSIGIGGHSGSNGSDGNHGD